MPLIERLTPGGNLYAAGSSTFSMLETLFRRMAEVRDVRDAELRTSITQGDNSLREAISQGDAAQKSAWQQADATVLDQAKADASTKANTAAANAQTAAVTTAVGQANTYTDAQVSAVQAGEVPDTRIDAGVDRALTDGRIDTTVNDTTVADLLGDPASAAGAAVDDVVETRGPSFLIPWASTTVNVKNPKYGYVSGQDNTTAIAAAWADANAQARCLYFPEGTYAYNGPGLTGIHPNIHGAGREKTKINLGATSRLFDIGGTVGSVDLGDFTLNGGLGLFRSTNTGNNVSGIYRVTNVHLVGYTSAAIEVNANDMPYWKFRDLIFNGANFTTTIGIALSGLTDGCAFENIEFLKNRVHIKMRYGGNNAYIRNCDFLRFGTHQGEPRVDIWLVPRSTTNNTGAGLTVQSCKFGAENLDPTDKRIVYADEGPGTTNGDMFPALYTASTGNISGHNVRDVMVAGVSGASFPLVYSTTPNISGCSYGDITLQGTSPEYVVEFLAPLTAGRLNSSNIIGPVYASGAVGIDTVPGPLPTNAHGFATIVDPLGFLSAAPGEVNNNTAGDPIRYRLLTSSATTAFTPVGTGSAANTTDSLGGTDARLVTFAAGGAGALQVQLVGAAANARVGEPVWIEFDAKAATSTVLRARMEESGPKYHFSRVVRLGPDWHRYRFLWEPRPISAGMYFKLEPTVTTGGSFSVGRVRIYHAQEPLNVDGLTVIGGTVYRLAVTNGAVSAVAV